MKEVEVLLPEVVLGELEREAERAFPNETGGVLLGYRDREEATLVQVMFQIGPGPNAVHKRHRFEPDSVWQQAQIALAYGQSGRIATYLGDWHSHPEGSPRLSKLDRDTARRIARCRQARARRPIMLILCGGPKSWNAAGHCAGRWRLRSTRTTVVPGDALAVP